MDRFGCLDIDLWKMFHILTLFNLGFRFISGPFYLFKSFPTSNEPRSIRVSQWILPCPVLWWDSMKISITWSTKVVVSDHKFAIEHENNGRLGMILETNTCPRCFCCLWLEGIRWPGRKYCNVSRLPSAYFRTNKKLGGQPQLKWRFLGRGR